MEPLAAMRKEELVRVAASAREAAVDLSTEVGQLMEDMACRMVLECSTREKFNLKPMVHEALNLAGVFNLADCIPFLGALDLQGMTRRAKARNRLRTTILVMQLSSTSARGL